MAILPDYYAILQVHPEAEKEVIDAAYRKLAAKYHPDVNQAPEAVEKMKQINVAHEVLSDPAKRAAYNTTKGIMPPPDAPISGAVSGLQYLSLAKRLVIPAGLIVFALAAFRLGPRLALLLVAFVVVTWLLISLTRSRR